MEEDTRPIVERCIREELKPYVKKIDTEAYYPRDYLTALGRSGLIRSDEQPLAGVLLRETALVEETSSVCMTTGFNLWCHLAAVKYLRLSDNAYLRQTILPQLENGDLLGGTGLSNPMKFYAGLERLQLREKLGYLALNGSATYSCEFDETIVPDRWIVSEQADAFVPRIRPVFVLYQIPLGLGITDSAIRSIERAEGKQNGCNRYLGIQVSELIEELAALRESTYALCRSVVEPGEVELKPFLAARLAAVKLALKAVQADMFHNGGAAYLQSSGPSRRLREAYFLANLTPTVKHLEKMLSL
ncbi:acyl-CoA dehydrogenase family protein [Paenibacillus ginsengihumi]|uniref:acyl-CoA dehydrogenase family protein n=1 Tax=Paenibacillus ginsengihumi TaxID=431596 RepID=UPI00037AFE92|nr:acyl-CoA dehydrogenase family protein [Paenibacillus ginsengihumi]